jgi:hypothetical protein
MNNEHGLPIVRACQAARLSRAAYYKPGIDWAARDGEVITALQAIAVEEQRWGFWKCHDRLRAQGYGWNHKRIWRVHCQLRLNLPRRKRSARRPSASLIRFRGPSRSASPDNPSVHTHSTMASCADGTARLCTARCSIAKLIGLLSMGIEAYVDVIFILPKESAQEGFCNASAGRFCAVRGLGGRGR